MQCLGVTFQEVTEVVQEAVEGFVVIVSEMHTDEHYAEVVQHIDYLAS